MITITFRLDTLLRRLQAHNDREYTLQDIAESTGLSRTTVSNIANNQNTRIDLNTLAKLIEFFTEEGLPITVDQLFNVDDDSPQ